MKMYSSFPSTKKKKEKKKAQRTNVLSFLFKEKKINKKK